MDFRIDSMGTAKATRQHMAEDVKKREQAKKSHDEQAEVEEKKHSQPEAIVISKEDVDDFLLMMGTPRMSKRIVSQIASARLKKESGKILNRKA